MNYMSDFLHVYININYAIFAWTFMKIIIIIIITFETELNTYFSLKESSLSGVLNCDKLTTLNIFLGTGIKGAFLMQRAD